MAFLQKDSFSLDTAIFIVLESYFYNFNKNPNI